MTKTKTPITVRIDPLLLKRVRLRAARDNRSVTNYIETALRRTLEPDDAASRRERSRSAAARDAE